MRGQALPTCLSHDSAARPEHISYTPLIFSMRAKRWVMTRRPDAVEFVDVLVGAVNWLRRRERRIDNNNNIN